MQELLARLAARDIRLAPGDNGALKISAPPGAVTAELRAELAANKAALLAHLAQAETLPPADRHAPLPLSAQQAHVLVLAAELGARPFYNMHVALRLDGPVDAERLAQAVGRVVQRHEALRTVFPSGAPLIQAAEAGRYFCRQAADDDVPAQLHDLIRQPLDVAAGPLFCAYLLTAAPAAHFLLLLAHHLVMDGRSFQIVLDDLAAAYADAPAAPAPAPYVDYAQWQQAWLASAEAERQRAFWRAQLTPTPPPLALPAGGATTGMLLSAEIDAATTAALAALDQTLYVPLLTAYAVTLRALTGQDDLVIGTPVENRPLPALEQVVGYFNSVVPLRLTFAPQQTLADALAHARTQARAALAHANLPHSVLAAEHPGLWRALFFYAPEPPRLVLPGVTAAPLDLFNGVAVADIDLTVTQRAGRLTLHLTLRDGGLPLDTAQAFLTCVTDLLRQLIDRPQTALTAAVAPFNRPAGSDAAFVAPRSQTERRLHDVWCAVLGRERISVHAGFFALGGDSLRALDLFGRINGAFGVNLPLATLFHADTIAQLAQIVDGQPPTDDAWATLVPIQPAGEQPPFFCIHGLTGDILWFRALGQRMGGDLPFYGVQSPGLDGVQPPLTTIEAMATATIAQIRIVQPHGPYRLGGASFGGTLALAIAQQLRAAGESVALVALFDHVPGTPQQRPGRIAFARAFVRNLPVWVDGIREIGAYRLWLRARRKGRNLFGRFRPAAHSLIDYAAQLPPHRRRVIEANYAALSAHVPQRYDGRVVLFRAAARPLLEPLDFADHRRALLPACTVYDVPGSHEGIFQPPHVERLAALLRQELGP